MKTSQWMCVLAAVLVSVPAAAQELIVNGSFEEPEVVGGEVHTNVPGWTVDDGPGIELQRNILVPPLDGVQQIELDSHGLADSRTTIHQDVPTCPGETYLLSLFYIPRPGVESNEIEVWWDGAIIATLSGQGGDWQQYAWTVDANPDDDFSRVTLKDVSFPDTLGGLIDLVSVVSLDDDCDDDGVLDDDDLCGDTAIPESVPSDHLGVNRFALTDGDRQFDTTAPRGRGPQRSYSLDDTFGCSCEQIIEAFDLGRGHEKFGCSLSAMDDWAGMGSD